MAPLRSLAVLAALFLVGCPTPPSPAELASEAARDLNMSARWGQIDVAAARTAPESREDFFKNRAGWGAALRILDTELAGLSMKDSEKATVQVDVSWTRDNDPTLRVTRIEQQWENRSGKWNLVTESRVGGALGLFGEEQVESSGPPPAQRHFPTRVIR